MQAWPSHAKQVQLGVASPTQHQVHVTQPCAHALQQLLLPACGLGPRDCPQGLRTDRGQSRAVSQLGLLQQVASSGQGKGQGQGLGATACPFRYTNLQAMHNSSQWRRVRQMGRRTASRCWSCRLLCVLH